MMKRKKKPAKRLFGILGQYRYIIDSNGVQRRKVSVIGDTAFVHSRDRGGFRKNETARVVPAKTVFPSNSAAVLAMKPQTGVITRYDKMFPGKRIVSASGGESLYDMKGDSVWGTFYPTKSAAAKAMLAEAKDSLLRAAKEHRAASKLVAKFSAMVGR